MDRTEPIRGLAAAFSQAAAARDWERLDEAARGLRGQLEALAAAGPWTGAELAALAQLRTAHEGAARVCDGAVLALQGRLDEIRSIKEGWMAYALDSATEPAGTQP